MKHGLAKKIVYSFVVLAIWGAVMLVLTHTAQNGTETTEKLPDINLDPVYVTYYRPDVVEGTEFVVISLADT